MHRRQKKDEVEISKELGNTSRNERQKSQLLSELHRMRRHQIKTVIEEGKQILEASKELCRKQRGDAKRSKKTG